MVNEKDAFHCFASCISEDAANDVIDHAIIATRQSVSEHMEQLLIRAGVTPYELQKITGISRQSIEQTLNQSRSIPKPVIFALCLVFKMEEEEALDLLYRCGFGLTKAPEDLIFKEFISRGIYRLRDYAEAVRTAYALLGCEEQLSAFFSREYTNDTV